MEYIGGRIGCEGPRPPRESCERRPSTPNDRPSFLQRSSATRPLTQVSLELSDVFAPAHLPFLNCSRSLRAQSVRPTRASQNNAAGRGTKEGPCAFGPRRRHGVDNPPSDRLIRPLRTPPAPGTPSCPCPIHTTRAVSPPLFIPAPSQTPSLPSCCQTTLTCAWPCNSPCHCLSPLPPIAPDAHTALPAGSYASCSFPAFPSSPRPSHGESLLVSSPAQCNHFRLLLALPAPARARTGSHKVRCGACTRTCV